MAIIMRMRSLRFAVLKAARTIVTDVGNEALKKQTVGSELSIAVALKAKMI